MAITARNLSGYRKVWADEGKPEKTCRRREKPLVVPGLPGRAASGYTLRQTSADAMGFVTYDFTGRQATRDGAMIVTRTDTTDLAPRHVDNPR